MQDARESEEIWQNSKQAIAFSLYTKKLAFHEVFQQLFVVVLFFVLFFIFYFFLFFNILNAKSDTVIWGGSVEKQDYIHLSWNLPRRALKYSYALLIIFSIFCIFGHCLLFPPIII